MLSNVTGCFRGPNAGRTAGVAGGSETGETSTSEVGGAAGCGKEDDGLLLVGGVLLSSSGIVVH